MSKKFDLVELDPYNCSIAELKKEIERLTIIKGEYNDIQMANKLYINSIYGAIGAVFFPYYNAAIAEAVTLQGQDLDKFAAKVIDEYFRNEWHLDKELHKKLNISQVNKLTISSLTAYGDTDSL